MLTPSLFSINRQHDVSLFQGERYIVLMQHNQLLYNILKHIVEH